MKARIDKVPGVSTRMLIPKEKSYYPTLHIEWDPNQIGLENWELGKRLLDGKPRIMTHAEGEGHSFVLRPAAMYPGEYRIVAERLYEEFRNARGPKPKVVSKPPATNLTGRWEIDITFLASSTTWRLYLDNNDGELGGVYSSPVVPEGTLTGKIDGDHVEIRSRGRHEGMAFNYVFTGTVRGDRMEGMVSLGWEDGSVPWVGRKIV